MFSKFKLKEITYSDIEEYECIGQEYYENKKKDIQNSLREFIGLDGIIDGTKLQENWFPTKVHPQLSVNRIEIQVLK